MRRKYGEAMETTTGRVIFNEAVPEDVPYINELLTKKNLKKGHQ
jgi:DNA-directed RNA polymerase subunit beta'